MVFEAAQLGGFFFVSHFSPFPFLTGTSQPPNSATFHSMKIQYDRFYRYTEFTEILHQFVKEFPELLAIESIGKSHEGRSAGWWR